MSQVAPRPVPTKDDVEVKYVEQSHHVDPHPSVDKVLEAVVRGII